MTFELTQSLINSIIFSMEDQTTVRLMDSKTGGLVVVKSRDEVLSRNEKSRNLLEDGDRYYALPEWSSADGYGLLEDFTESVQSSEVRKELRDVLVNGRGVFRNFKNVIKANPELQRQWNIFKAERMKVRVLEWYNGLRESWGLDVYEMQVDDIETEDLLLDDFGFGEYDPVRDKDDVIHGREELAEEMKFQFTGDIGEAQIFVWQKECQVFDNEEKTGFVCRSGADDFAGCILTCCCSSSSKKTVLVTDFFVLQSFRSLGIGKELLSKCLAHLKGQGTQWLLISNSNIPEFMEPMLTNIGFEKQGLFFVADLFNLF